MAHKPTYVVVGLGAFGSETAAALSKRGGSVLAIDQDQQRIDAIANQVSKAVCCDALDEEAMEEAGAFDVHAAIVAVGHRFDVSVLATHIFVRHEVEQVMVQVNSHRESTAIRSVGATSVVFPEYDTARRIAQRLQEPDLLDKISLGRDAGMIEVPCPGEFVGRSLRELDLRRQHQVNVVALKQPAHGDDRQEPFSFLPEPDQPLQSEQILVVLGRNKDLVAFRERIAGR